MGVRSPLRATGARFIALLLLPIACSQDDSATGIANTALEDQAIVLSTIDPDTATVDTTVTVRITGSGFTEGSTATWLIDTTEAPGIRTLSTTWNSAAELEALIVISADAELRSYSIRIRGKKGKQGIAVERFRVVAKPIPLPEPGTRSEAVDVNDSGVIAGWSDDASGFQIAIRWTPLDSGWSYTILGPGVAAAVNNDGLILRRNYDALTRDWSSWVHLPSGGEVALGPVAVSDISNNGTIIGWIYDAEFKRHAVAWKQVSATSWSGPQSLPIPDGYTDAWVDRINVVGDIAGGLSSTTGTVGVVWKYRDGEWQPPQPVDLAYSAGANAMNDAGALAGWMWPCVPGTPTCSTSAVFWPSLGAPRQILPTLYNSRGFVRGMNNVNLVVGSALVHYNDGSGPLNAFVRHAVVWFPGGQFPEDLGAFRPWEYGEATAINNHGLVVGSVIKGFSLGPHATAWKLPGGLTTATPARLRRP